MAAAGVVAIRPAAAQTPSPASPPTTTTTTKPRKFPLIAPIGLRPILDRERRARRRADGSASTTTSQSTTTTVAPTPTTIPGTATPYHVGVLHQTFVDHSRGTPARGGHPSSSSRHIATTIYYPTNLAPSEQNPKPKAAPGPFPLVVFAHGYAIDAAAYEPLLRDLAAGGFVVAAPDFPGTSTAYDGGAIRSDSLQQPGDCLLYTSPSPRDGLLSRMPSSA